MKIHEHFSVPPYPEDFTLATGPLSAAEVRELRDAYGFPHARSVSSSVVEFGVPIDISDDFLPRREFGSVTEVDFTSPADLFRSAKLLRKKENYGLAGKLFQLASEQIPDWGSPEKVRSLLYAASCFSSDGQIGQASVLFIDVVKQLESSGGNDELLIPALLGKGRALYHLELEQQAHKTLEKYLSLAEQVRPDAKATGILHGVRLSARCCEAVGEYDSALTRFGLVADIAKDEPRDNRLMVAFHMNAICHRARILFRLGEDEKGSKELAREVFRASDLKDYDPAVNFAVVGTFLHLQHSASPAAFAFAGLARGALHFLSEQLPLVARGNKAFIDYMLDELWTRKGIPNEAATPASEYIELSQDLAALSTQHDEQSYRRFRIIAHLGAGRELLKEAVETGTEKTQEESRHHLELAMVEAREWIRSHGPYAAGLVDRPGKSPEQMRKSALHAFHIVFDLTDPMIPFFIGEGAKDLASIYERNPETVPESTIEKVRQFGVAAQLFTDRMYAPVNDPNLP